MRRQVRECQAKLPPGWYIAAYYWDIESGGLTIYQRGHGIAHEHFTDIGIPRDGGLADLLAEAASPAPRFAATSLTGPGGHRATALVFTASRRSNPASPA
jgi:hypothetical protein